MSNQQNVSDEISRVHKDPDLPQSVSDQGVEVRQTQFTSQVVDENNKPLISSPETSNINIEIPAEKEILETLSKGPVESAVTWLANFWLRMIKKASRLGWGVRVKQQ